MTTETRKEKFAAAEGLLNHIRGKNRMSAIADIVRYSEKIYEIARQHEREDSNGVTNDN